MLSERLLRKELKRLPSLIKKAVKDDDLELVVEMMYSMETIEWIVNSEDCD